MSNLLALSDWLTIKRVLVCILLQVTLIPIVAGCFVCRLNAGRRHTVLLGVLLMSLACPFLVTLCHLGGLRFPIAVASIAETAVVSDGDSAARNRPVVESTAALPMQQPTRGQSETIAPTFSAPAMAAGNEIDMPAAVTPGVRGVDWSVMWFEIALGLWVTGILIGILRLVAGWYWVRRVLAKVTELPVPASVVQAISVIFATPSPSIRLYESNRTTIPNVTGVWRPRIVLPQGMGDRLSQEELTAIVTHEYAHARRADCAIGLIQRIAAVLYWFHPIVHWLNRQISVAREEICDNYALQVIEPHSYAKLLLKLSEHRPAVGTVGVPLLSPDGRLEDRIKKLLDTRRDLTTTVKSISWVSLVAMLSFGLFASSAQLVATPNEDRHVESRQAARVDLYGDPIPYGGVVRLGTSRFRPVGDSWHRKITFSPEGLVLTRTTDGILDWWDPQTGKKVRSADLGFTTRGFAVAPDRSTIAMGYFRYEHGSPETDYGIAIVDSNTGARTRTIPLSRTSDETYLFYTPDGKNLLSVSENGKVNVFDLGLEDSLLDYDIPLGRRVEAAALSPDGTQVAVAGNRTIWLWNWLDGTEPRTLNGLGELHLHTMDFTPDGNALVLGHDRGREGVEVVAVRTGEVLHSFRDPGTKLMRFANFVFANDARLLIAPNYANGNVKDNSICIWDLESGKLDRQLRADFSPPGMVALSSDERLLATAGEGEVVVWDLATGERLGEQYVAHTATITAVRFLPGSDRVVTAADDQTARVWEASTGKLVGRIDHDHWVRGIGVSPDGKWVATSSLDDTVRLCSTKTLAPIYELPGHGRLGGRRTVAFTRDSKRFASFGDEPYLRVWDVATGRALLEVELRPNGESLRGDGPGAEFMNLDCGFSQDATRLFVGKNGKVFVFDATTGKQLKEIESARPIEGASFAPDNKHLLVSRPYVDPTRTPLDDGRVRFSAANKFEVALIEIERGDVVWTFKMDGLGGPARIAPAGDIAVASMRDSTGHDVVYLLNAKSGKLLTKIDVGELAWDSNGSNVAFSSKGQLAIPMQNASVILWDLKQLGVWK